MSPTNEIGPNTRRAFRCMLLLIGLCAYFGLPAWRPFNEPMRGQFVELSMAFLRGETSFHVDLNSNLRIGELIPADQPDRVFCGYPPLPAVLLMPFVWLFGSSITVEFATRAISLVNILLVDMCLTRLPGKLGRPLWPERDRLMLTAFFAFGTAAWSNTQIAGDWHLAHAVAYGAMLCALLEQLGRGRFGLTGVFVGLAMLARPTVGLSGAVFVLAPLFERKLGGLLKLAVGPVVAVALFGAYNYVRFGSPTEIGYDRMFLVDQGQELMQRFGQFNLAYVPRNLFWFFIAPPVLLESRSFPWIGFDPMGMSLFLASPAFLYVFYSLRRDRSSLLVWGAWIGAILALVPLLLYFNTGYWQFGQRFSLDYLAMLVILVGAGVGRRLSRIAIVLILVSILIHAYAMLFVPSGSLGIDFIPTA